MSRSVMLQAILALLLSVCLSDAIAQNAEATGPLVIARQGSFSVGGRTVQGSGVFDPTKSPDSTNEGQTLWVDQMYVQYQIPVTPRMYPLVLVHGGGGTGRPGGRHQGAASWIRARPPPGW